MLDVGVSGMDDQYRSLNFFLSHYRYEPSTYTGLGIEDMSEVQARYPAHRFVQYDGRIFPFADGEFDWIHSNAVMEQLRLLSHGDLVSLLKRSGATRYSIFRNRFLGWTMTMSAVAQRQ